MIFAVAAFAFLIFPSYSNIGANDSSASCDNSTIGATSGTTTLEAQWQANTINISWYDGDSEITPTNEAAGECRYDNPITLPSNVLSRNGYTFDGWKIRAAQAQCDLTSLDTSKAGLTYIYKKISSNECRYHNGSSPSDIDCSDSKAADLDNGEWKVTFEYGTIKGIASCNTTAGGPTTSYEAIHITRPGDTFSTSSTGQYCWCKITQLNDLSCPVSYPWVFSIKRQDDATCLSRCAAECVSSMKNSASFRSIIFGQTQQ